MMVAGIFAPTAALIMLGNVVICFQLAMQGSGYTNRWYMLFFATYELLVPYLRMSFLARLALLGASVAWMLLATRLLINAGPQVRTAYAIGTLILLSGFVVAAWGSRYQ